MKKLEFSKVLFLVVYITSLVFSALTVVVSIIGGDAASVANIALAMWGTTSIATGFYFWKAKAENMIKIYNSMPAELLNKIEAVSEFFNK